MIGGSGLRVLYFTLMQLATKIVSRKPMETKQDSINLIDYGLFDLIPNLIHPTKDTCSNKSSILEYKKILS